MSDLIDLNPALAKRVVDTAEELETEPATFPTQYVRAMQTRLDAEPDEPLTMPRSDIVSIAHGFYQAEDDGTDELVDTLASVATATGRFEQD